MSEMMDGLENSPPEAFLAALELPAAWAGQAQWRILEWGFGRGVNFLATWAAWCSDPQRPPMLHFVSCEAKPVSAQDVLQAAAHAPLLQPLAQALAAQCWGLLPGVHRLSFEEGCVLLTLYVGEAPALLRQERPVVDSIYLGRWDVCGTAEPWSLDFCKTVARCCRRGTRWVFAEMASQGREMLAQCGFEVHPGPGVVSGAAYGCAVFHPAWELRNPAPGQKAGGVAVSSCVVVGAGLAGAAVAASLARRGWQVLVLDQADTPASAASGLPVGVFAPHTSPDDAPLSRLTRAGIRTTQQTASALLSHGVDWAASGVLEHCVEGRYSVPAAWLQEAQHPGRDWSCPSHAAQRAACRLPEASVAQWHACGGWVRPLQLVQALLAQPGVTWRGGVQVARLECVPAHEDSSEVDAGLQWRLWDAQGQMCAQAARVVLATGAGSIELCAPFLQPQSLRPLRGQVCFGVAGEGTQHLPPWPVNGHGNFVPCVPTPQGMLWSMGSTFERGQTALPKTAQALAQGRQAIAQRLRELLPAGAQVLAERMEHGQSVQSWAGVRCVAPDRRPMVGALAPGLYVSTAMGARGLAHTLLCGELLAAQWHAEPLPLEAKLAQWLSPQRWLL